MTKHKTIYVKLIALRTVFMHDEIVLHNRRVAVSFRVMPCTIKLLECMRVDFNVFQHYHNFYSRQNKTHQTFILLTYRAWNVPINVFNSQKLSSSFGRGFNVWFFSSVVTLITKQQWQKFNLTLIGLFNQYGGQM
jgi:hypothetical protein